MGRWGSKFLVGVFRGVEERRGKGFAQCRRGGFGKLVVGVFRSVEEARGRVCRV